MTPNGCDMILRNARLDETETCYQFVQDAIAYQRSLGFVQWHEGYPGRDLIEHDIENGIGYVFAEEDRLLGYCCILVGEEPAYRDIKGAWKTDLPYAVVHRMAFGAETRGHGFSKAAFSLIKDLCLEKGIDAIRIDTHNDNKVMQHILAREGFVYCGQVMYDGPKLAFEWDRA